MFGAVKQAVRDASGSDLSRHLQRDLDDAVADIFASINLLQVEGARILAELRDRGEGVSVLRERCRMTHPEVRSRLRVADTLVSLPETRAAAAAGEIGYDHLKVICHCVDEVGLDAFRQGGAEPILLECARKVDARDLRLVTRRMRNLLEPDEAAADAAREFERRYLNLSQTLHGVWYLDGRLDAEGGALLQTALQPLMHRLGVRDWEPREARADALVELARRVLATGELGTSGGVRPHLLLTSSVDAAAGRPSVGGELTWAGVVPGETVRRLCCDASVSVVEVGSDGEPLSVGRARRTVPPSLRRALIARDRGCVWPGCDRPSAWTDAHHLRTWAEGGETSVGNLALVCRAHHVRLHEGGYQLVRTATGWDVLSPFNARAG